MHSSELTKVLQAAFGAGSSIRPRRPNKLYQIDLPAFFGDGDAAAIFVRLRDDGLLTLTDLGHTCMRLSYTRIVTPAVEEAVSALASKHGFTLTEQRIESNMPPDEILAGALGLLQIESEAEAAIEATVARGERSEAFRSAVRKEIESLFRDACVFDYHEKNDVDGLYSIDALITLEKDRHIGIAIVPNNIDAERAVSSKLHLAKTIPARARWIAIAKDANQLGSKTRLRLMREYLVPVPKYEDERSDQIRDKLLDLAV